MYPEDFRIEILFSTDVREIDAKLEESCSCYLGGASESESSGDIVRVGEEGVFRLGEEWDEGNGT